MPAHAGAGSALALTCAMEGQAAAGTNGFLHEYVGRVGLGKSYGEARVDRLDRWLIRDAAGRA